MSEKYLAGFFDADGYFSVRARKGSKPDLEASICQKEDFVSPIYEAQSLFGGKIRKKTYKGNTYLELCLRSGPAMKCAERLKKYMVLKQEHVEKFIDLVTDTRILRTEEDVAAIRCAVKEVRSVPALAEPNYPARKWMAGYIDGDGSFAAKRCKKTGYAYPFLTILAAKNYTVGINLLCKAFGGAIHRSGNNFVWQVQLSQPDKAKKVIGHCLPHLQKKYSVARFIYECANNGNFRDGEAIRRTITALNSQQHRLSDPTFSVSEYISPIRFDIDKKTIGRPIGRIETQPRKKRQSNL